MRYTIDEVESCVRGEYRYWAGLLYIDCTAVRITWFLANFTKFTPNQVTAAHFVLRLGAFNAFYFGTRSSLVVGAILYQISIILDDVDGKLARVKNMSSATGKYLDHMCDAVGDFLCIAALLLLQMRYSQDLTWQLLAVSVPFLYLFVTYESLMFNETFVATGAKKEGELCRTNQDYTAASMGVRHKLLVQIKQFSRKLRVSLVTLDMADIAILLFVVGPLFGEVRLMLFLGLFFMLERLVVGKGLFYFRKVKSLSVGEG